MPGCVKQSAGQKQQGCDRNGMRGHSTFSQGIAMRWIGLLIVLSLMAGCIKPFGICRRAPAITLVICRSDKPLPRNHP